MKKMILIIFFIFSLINTFANNSIENKMLIEYTKNIRLYPETEISEEYLLNSETDSQLPETEEISDNSSSENRDNSESNSIEDTYIPLERYQKEAIYWSIKGPMIAGTAALSLSIFILPTAPDSLSRDNAYEYFGTRCHQSPNRSFFIDGEQMPLCARCTGITLGYFGGLFDSFIWDSFRIKGLTKAEQGAVHIAINSLLLIPMAADGLTQAYTDYESNNPWRLINGFLFSYALTSIGDEIIQLILDY